MNTMTTNSFVSPSSTLHPPHLPLVRVLALPLPPKRRTRTKENKNKNQYWKFFIGNPYYDELERSTSPISYARPRGVIHSDSGSDLDLEGCGASDDDGGLGYGFGVRRKMATAARRKQQQQQHKSATMSMAHTTIGDDSRSDNYKPGRRS